MKNNSHTTEWSKKVSAALRGKAFTKKHLTNLREAAARRRGKKQSEKAALAQEKRIAWSSERWQNFYIDVVNLLRRTYPWSSDGRHGTPWNKGKTLSLDELPSTSRKRMASVKLGHPYYPVKDHNKEARNRKIKEALTGKPKTEEHNRNVRAALNSKKGPDGRWHRPKLSLALKNSDKFAVSQARHFYFCASFLERLAAARLQKAAVNYKQSQFLPASHHPYDFVLPDIRTVIEVDGCYFHGCPLHESLDRKTVAKWIRDTEIDFYAIGQGYRVIRLWEHDVLAPKRPQSATGIDVVGMLRKGNVDDDLRRVKQFFYCP